MVESYLQQSDHSIIQTVRNLSEATEKVRSQLETISYEAFIQYLEQRNVFMEQIQNHPWTAQQKLDCEPFVKQIIEADPKIRQKMDEFRQEAVNELDKIHAARKQQAGYQQQAYPQDYSSTSLFFDQRK